MGIINEMPKHKKHWLAYAEFHRGCQYQICNVCGFIWITTKIIRCPRCNSANVKVFPVEYVKKSWIKNE